jgi:predicted TIM-barrel fold metal-dependent hydrolase
MIEGKLVVDAVAHGYDVSPTNRATGCPGDNYDGFGMFMHKLGHLPLESRAPGYMLTEEEFRSRWSAEALASAFFLESDTDVVFYHHINYPGFFAGGISRLDTGLALRELAPGRVFVYGGVDSLAEDRQASFAQMEEMAAQGVTGFKFYPANGTFDEATMSFRHMKYDDPESAYPYFEKARELGVTHLAFHKAMPLGPELEGVKVGDMMNAAIAFPDLTFEIVHAGSAFLEETAFELLLAPNIYANLECSANLIVRQPRRFAEMIGKMLQTAGGHQKLLYASGCAVAHPDPILRAFHDFQMPQDLVEGFDYPELTREMKADILGGNMIALHGLDEAALRETVGSDEWAARRAEGKVEPWAGHRARAGLVGAG